MLGQTRFPAGLARRLLTEVYPTVPPASPAASHSSLAVSTSYDSGLDGTSATSPAARPPVIRRAGQSASEHANVNAPHVAYRANHAARPVAVVASQIAALQADTRARSAAWPVHHPLRDRLARQVAGRRGADARVRLQ